MNVCSYVATLHLVALQTLGNRATDVIHIPVVEPGYRDPRAGRHVDVVLHCMDLS